MIYQQQDQILSTTVRSKLTQRSVMKWKEAIIPYPSIISKNHLIPKIKSIRDGDPNVYMSSSHDLYYLCGEEIQSLLSVEDAVKFVNAAGHIIKLHKQQNDYLKELIYDDNYGLLQAVQDVTAYSKIYKEDLIISQLEKQNKILKQCAERTGL